MFATSDTLSIFLTLLSLYFLHQKQFVALVFTFLFLFLSRYDNLALIALCIPYILIINYPQLLQKLKFPVSGCFTPFLVFARTVVLLLVLLQFDLDLVAPHDSFPL